MSNGVIVPQGIRIAITAIVLSAITVLSVTPGESQVGDGIFVWIVMTTPMLLQKSLHVVAYGALCASFWWTLERLSPAALRFAAALLLAIAAGALLEWYQTLVPGRFGSLWDVLLNAFGALLGVVAVNLAGRGIDRPRRSAARRRS